MSVHVCVCRWACLWPVCICVTNNMTSPTLSARMHFTFTLAFRSQYPIIIYFKKEKKKEKYKNTKNTNNYLFNIAPVVS